MESRPKTHLLIIHHLSTHMMCARLLLYFCFLSFIVSCTSKIEKAKPVIQSITVMGLCSVDSATAINQRHGIGRYIHFDFTNDSASIYRKEYSFSDGQLFNRFKKDTLIINLKADTILNNFATRLTTYDFTTFYKEEAERAKRVDDQEGIVLCNSIRAFYVILKTDSNEQAFAYSGRIEITEFEKATELFISLTEKENLKATTSRLNEDSLMAPILARKELFDIFIPPLPPPPPPPPAKN